MFIPKILAFFLSAVAGAASSDIHSPTLNTEEDVVVSSPNLRSLATTEQRDLARTEKPPFDDDDQDGFEIALSLKWTIPKPKDASVGQIKTSVLNLFNLALQGYDEDGTQVLGLVSLPDGDGNGDGRELQASEIVYNFGLNLLNKICNRPALTDPNDPGILRRETCYCFAAKRIVALLNLYSAELAVLAL